MLWSVLFFGTASTKGRISVGVPVQHKQTMKATFKNSKKAISIYKMLQKRIHVKYVFFHISNFLFSVFCV